MKAFAILVLWITMQHYSLLTPKYVCGSPVISGCLILIECHVNPL